MCSFVNVEICVWPLVRHKEVHFLQQRGGGVWGILSCVSHHRAIKYIDIYIDIVKSIESVIKILKFSTSLLSFLLGDFSIRGIRNSPYSAQERGQRTPRLVPTSNTWTNDVCLLSKMIASHLVLIASQMIAQSIKTRKALEKANCIPKERWQ